MTINLICLGNIKENFYKEAIKEYEKRLSRYIKLNIIELKDEKTKQNSSVLEEEKIKNIEGNRILSKLKDNSYVLSLDLRGTKYDSENFAKHISELEVKSKGELNFVIGASLGLSKDVLKRSNESISFSDMTFPHQLMRVIFLEQLYRAYKIINNEPYHK